MFTILIAAYNGNRWVEEAIATAQSQTFRDFECLILDNGSTDSTREIATKAIVNDSRFHYHYLNTANKANALNYGIMVAKNDWIAVLDVDDLWDPEKLAAQATFIQENPDIDIIGTRFKYFGYGDDVARKTPELPLDHAGIMAWLDRCENPFATSSVVYKKDIHFRGVGLYNTMYYSVEDYEIWKKARMRGMKFINLPFIGMLHRIHPPSPYQTTDRQNICKALVDVLYTDLTDVRHVAYFTEMLQRFDEALPKRAWSDGHSVRHGDEQ